MNRLRFPLLAAMALIVPASTVQSAPVPAARSGLEQVPATAPLVIHIRGVQGVHARLETMLENALPDVLKKIKPQLDDFFENGPDNLLKGRKLSGLAKDGPIFWVFTELPKPNDPGEPKIAIILAVSNYQEFRDNILTEEQRKNIKNEDGIEATSFDSKPVYFVNRKGYAVVTPDKEVAATFTKKIAGLHEKMNKELADKLLASDAGIYVNMDTVNKDYAEQIKEAKQGIEQALALATAGAGDESQKKVVEAIKKAIGPVFQAVEDMQAVLATVELRPGGLALHVQSEMKKDTATANLLQDSRPIAFKDLDRMPTGRAYYTGMKTSSALYKALGSLMVGIPLGKGAEDSDEIASALKELAKAGPVDRLDGYTFPLSGLQVAHYDDPAKAVAAQVKLFKHMAESDPKSVGLREKAILKMDAEKFGDFKLHSVQLAWDFEKMAEPVAQRGDEAKKQFIESMKNILGDKRTIWFGTDGKALVQVTAANWEGARKLLDQYSKGSGTIGEVQAFRDARKEMPARTSLLSLVDPVHVAGIVLDAFRPLIPVGQLPPGWPHMPAKGTPTGFVGLSVTLQPNRGALDLFITAAAAQEVYKALIKPLVGE